MDTITIREFRYPVDYPAVIQLWETAGPGVRVGLSDSPEEIEKKLQRDPDLFIVAERDGQIVGSIIGGFDGRRGMMYHLAVDTTCRRQRIATRLFAELEERLRAKGCIRYYLMVVNGNHDAKNFYKNSGMEPLDLVTYAKSI